MNASAAQQLSLEQLALLLASANGYLEQWSGLRVDPSLDAAFFDREGA